MMDSGGAGISSPSYNGIQVPASQYGLPLPIVYGTTKISPNLVWYRGFSARQSSTGKGFGSQSGSFGYSADVQLVLCEGPISSVLTSFNGTTQVTNLGATMSMGPRTNPIWSYITSNYPLDQQMTYSGMAWVGIPNCQLTSSATLPLLTFEVKAIYATVADPYFPSAMDARPCNIIADFLTNPYYGAGWPSAWLAPLAPATAASYDTYCTALGIAISPAFTTRRSALAHIQDILTASNSDMILSEVSTGVMQINVIPYGDMPVTANGVTYTPATTPIYALGYDDFLGVVDNEGRPTGNDAVTTKRVSLQDTYNTIPVQFLDRRAFNPDGTSNSYAASLVQVSEPLDAQVNGTRVGSSLTLNMVTRSELALLISQIAGQRQVNIRNLYTFRVGWRYILLEPMDFISITDPNQGLAGVICRIVSIDYPDEAGETEGMTITAEQWPFGTGHAATYQVASSSGGGPNFNAAPGNTSPVIFNVPALYSQSGQAEVIIGAAGGSIWGGCQVWVSYDNATYSLLGTISNSCRCGTLGATLPTSATYSDTTNTLQAVQVTSSQPALVSLSSAVAADLNGMLWVDGELIAYTNSALVTSGTYNLTNLFRGCYGTTISSHASGASWCFLDSVPLQFTLPQSRNGLPVYFKFLSFNIFGQNMQTLAGVSAVTFTPSIPNYPQPINVTWTVS